jgi:hypothetical protein
LFFYHFLDDSTYEHLNVVLAQGLEKMGHTNIGNINYWEDFGNDFLIKESEIPKNKDSIAIVSSWFALNNYKEIPKIQKHFQSYFLLDQEDGGEVTSCESLYPSFTGVLRCHYNKALHTQDNVFPWAFGITNHMIDWLDRIERIDSEIIQTNFRVKHETRVKGVTLLKKLLKNKASFDQKIDVIDFDFMQKLSEEQIHYFRTTKHRCLPSFLNRLKGSMLAPAFGGWFYDQSRNRVRRIINRVLHKANFHIASTYALVNFDSWRFWESMFAGVPTIHFDLERYSACFPIQPINGVHYIGLDLKGKVNGESLKKVLERKESIGIAGRQFSKQNYSPEAMAHRFISLI